MNLPSSGITWRHYRNETPTFDLTPVEKPDLSPFLIHMTGKNSLVSILKGENRPEEIKLPLKSGYIKSSKPAFDSQAQYYNSEVVCFTESPIFALDFFRYRSFRRWSNDQQYGIGFSKSDLVKYRNVRPVVYLDKSTNSTILDLCNKIIDGSYEIQSKEGVQINLIAVFESIKPLLFPLLEDTSYQGFMWEREWRYPFSTGLVFPHNAIKVICCPSNERAEIVEILGDLASQIEIVESWREYDDVTNYLKRRKGETNIEKLSHIQRIRDFGVLFDLKEQNERTLNTLEAYYGVFKETVTSLEGRNINQTIDEMKQKSKEIDEQIKSVRAEIKKKEEQAKMKK